MSAGDLYRLTMTRDELLLLGAVAGLGADVVHVGVAADPHAARTAVLRFLTEFTAVPDRLATIHRLAAKLDPLLAAAKRAT
jgi:hypothetical protein